MDNLLKKCIEFEDNKTIIDEATKINNGLKAEIVKEMQEQKFKVVEAQTLTGEEFEVTLVERSDWAFDIEGLSEHLLSKKSSVSGAKAFKNITDKTYSVNEPALRRFLKAHPDLKHELAQVIIVTRSVNKTKLIAELTEDNINFSDVEPYTVITEKNYIKLTKKKH